LGSAAVGLAVQIHQPRVNDEFSYLLAADTFSRGRLTNPPHPMWVHLETFQVLHQPTYASKYPPGQGMAMAAGKFLAGHPIAGVWASVAGMCAAVAWMLLAWFPARWALLGGLLVALRFGVVGYWSQSYWGGAVAAMGGALVLGALPRVVRQTRARDAVWMGLGLAILANSRPFEGLLASLPTAVVLLKIFFGPLRWRTLFFRLLVPLGLVLGLVVAWMSYYNWRVTGDPLHLPYSVHHDTYSFIPLFLFQELRPVPEYKHEMIEKNYTKLQLTFYQARQDFRSFVRSMKSRLHLLWRFYLGFVWTIPLLAVSTLRKHRGMQFCFLTCATVLAGSFLTTFGGYPHYLAPATGAMVALLVGALQKIGQLRWGELRLGPVLVLAFVLATMAQLISGVREHPMGTKDWSHSRARLLERFSSGSDRHLVLVRYDPSYNPQAEWVHNEADIDGAKVVWARAMRPEQDRELLEYFADRRAWWLEVDLRSWRLSPYPTDRLKNPKR
jgi:MFS family permease